MVPGVLDLVVDITALVSDVLNLGGDVGILVDVRDFGVDIGDLVADLLVLGVGRDPFNDWGAGGDVTNLSPF